MPMYMFPQWLHEQFYPESNSLHSFEISELCETIGTSQIRVRSFFKRWIEAKKVNSEVYYDITSVSSYAAGIDFIEWGYNIVQSNLFYYEKE